MKRKIFSILFALVLVAVVLPAGVAQAAPTLYENYNTGDNGFAGIFSTVWGAQTFTAESDHSVTSVKLKLYRHGFPGTITVSITATDGSGHPTGSDLTSGTTDGNTLTTNFHNANWREITLTSYNLTSGTKYAIVVRAPGGDGSNYVGWREDTVGAYADGNYERSSDSGNAWSTYINPDLMFEVYGSPIECSTIIDADGVFTSDDGIPGAVEVSDGDPLRDFGVTTAYFLSKIAMFDTDSSGSWTEGDDLIAIPTFPHAGASVLTVILDKDESLTPSSVPDFYSGSAFWETSLRIRYYDANSNNVWDTGEDIVLDANGDYIFNLVCDPAIPIEDLVDIIASFDPSDFSNPNHQGTLINKVNAIINNLDLNDVNSICDAIDKLTNDLLPKTDGDTPPPDWVTDPAAQQQLEDAINNIINALQNLADALGGC